MKKRVGQITLELKVDTVMIRDAKTSRLIKAKSFPARDAVEEFEKLVKSLEEIERQKTLDILNNNK